MQRGNPNVMEIWLKAFHKSQRRKSKLLKGAKSNSVYPSHQTTKHISIENSIAIAN